MIKKLKKLLKLNKSQKVEINEQELLIKSLKILVQVIDRYYRTEKHLEDHHITIAYSPIDKAIELLVKTLSRACFGNKKYHQSFATVMGSTESPISEKIEYLIGYIQDYSTYFTKANIIDLITVLYSLECEISYLSSMSIYLGLGNALDDTVDAIIQVLIHYAFIIKKDTCKDFNALIDEIEEALDEEAELPSKIEEYLKIIEV